MAQTKSRSKRLFLEPLEDRCLLSTADPAIAFVSRIYNGSYTYNLTVMNGDGSNQAVIWTRSGGIISSAIQKSSWSPQSGTTSPFQGSLVVGALNGGVNPSLPGSSIFRIDVTVTSSGVVQASTPTRLVANDSFQPSWSPTGNYIAFSGDNGTMSGQTPTQGGIYLVPATGGTPTLVVPVPNIISDVAAYPTWSPDGTSIAYEWRSGSSYDSLLVKQVIDPTTGLPITNGPVTTVVPASAGFSFIQQLDWSKSSLTNRIAFVLFSNSYPNGVIYTVDASGNTSPQIVPSTLMAWTPTWSPDDPTTSANETDKFLIYAPPVTLGKHSSGFEIARQELATGNVTVVVPATSGSFLRWTDWRRAPDAGWAPGTALSTAAPSLTTSAARLASVNNSLIVAPAQTNGDWSAPVTITGGQQGRGFATPSKLPTAAGKSTETVWLPSQTSWHLQSEPLFHFRSLKAVSQDALDEFWSSSGAGVLHDAVKDDLALAGIA